MALSAYLQRYGENTDAAALVRERYQHVLCIPAFAEDHNFLGRLLGLPGESVLVIVVLNAPDTQTNPALLDITTRFDALVTARLRQLRHNSAARLHRLNDSHRHDLLLIDRHSTGRRLPASQGVGLARRIACDLACHLIDNGSIASPWIHSSDADVFFPDGYFAAAEQPDPASDAAAIYPFRHRIHQDQRLALCQHLYDLSLRHYVSGLELAGSPYAFHTIGSTLLINASHYAKVRGFPKRSAAEDFYLLNKLAKTGRIIKLPGPELEIETRQSTRVPFGTGPAISAISELEDPVRDFRFYHPDIFVCLRALLNTVPECWQYDADLTSNAPACLQEPMKQVLTTLQFDTGLSHARRHSKTRQAFLRHIHQWFDGFRTLRFVHMMRDAACPSVNVSQII